MFKKNRYDQIMNSFKHHYRNWNCNIGRKIGVIAIIFGVSVTILTGCQLVEEEQAVIQEETTNDDIFCGAFFSSENFFSEDELNLSEEELQKILNGEEFDVENPEDESRRIYAQKSEKTEKNGFTHVDYVFEGYSGFAAYLFRVLDEENETTLYISEGGVENIVNDIEMSIDSDDNSEKYMVSGTVYLNKEIVDTYDKQSDSQVLYVYYIYQTKTGEIYMTPADANYGYTFEGAYSLSESIKIDKNGELQEYIGGVSITFDDIIPTDRTVLCQMDANNKLIDTIEIDNGNIPDDVDINPDTKYLIVEGYSDNELCRRDFVEMEPENEHEEEMYVNLPVKTDDDLFLKHAKVELKKR